jgi:enamine deaminase RidA (YjgF/YER057c/UK114 family)
MDVEMLHPEGVFQPAAYAQAARVGDMLFVAGQTPRNVDGSTAAPGDIRGQAEKVFENLQAVLEGCGSSLDHVAKLTVYIRSGSSRSKPSPRCADKPCTFVTRLLARLA